jgi:hypothetical protein
MLESLYGFEEYDWFEIWPYKRRINYEIVQKPEVMTATNRFDMSLGGICYHPNKFNDNAFYLSRNRAYNEMTEEYLEHLKVNSMQSFGGFSAYNYHYMLKFHQRGMYFDENYISDWNVSTRYDENDYSSLNITKFQDYVFDVFFNGTNNITKHKTEWNDTSPYLS